MNKATLTGRVKSISEVKSFTKNGTTHKYRTVVIDINKGIIAANYWEDDELPAIGKNVDFTIKINSFHNNKDPELFYHTINLHSIYENNY